MSSAKRSNKGGSLTALAGTVVVRRVTERLALLKDIASVSELLTTLAQDSAEPIDAMQTEADVPADPDAKKVLRKIEWLLTDVIDYVEDVPKLRTDTRAVCQARLISAVKFHKLHIIAAKYRLLSWVQLFDRIDKIGVSAAGFNVVQMILKEAVRRGKVDMVKEVYKWQPELFEPNFEGTEAPFKDCV